MLRSMFCHHDENYLKKNSVLVKEQPKFSLTEMEKFMNRKR